MSRARKHDSHNGDDMKKRRMEHRRATKTIADSDAWVHVTREGRGLIFLETTKKSGVLFK